METKRDTEPACQHGEPWPEWQGPTDDSHRAYLNHAEYVRARACVNACAGISTTDLELSASVSGTQTNPYSGSHPRLSARIEAAKIPQHFRNVEQQRNTLLSLLKENRKHGIAFYSAIESTDESFDFEDWAKRVDAAITSVEGHAS